MQRLDSESWTRFHKWTFYVGLACIWCFYGYRTVTSGDLVLPFLIGLTIASALLFWWFSTVKEVWIDRSTIIIKGSGRETRAPLSTLHHVNVWKGKIAYITLVFHPRTTSGRCVRIIPKYSHFDKVATLLQAKVEKNKQANQPLQDNALDRS